MDQSAVVDTDRAVEIKPKVHFTGKVLKIGLAGAIIDLGANQKGVLHISQLTPSPTNEPIKGVGDVLQIGQPVEVWVRKVKEGRIELTMIKPLDLEWRDIKKGMVVKGKVVRLEKFGAFVEIGAERPGLVHISEMAHGYVRTPADVVSEGGEVEAQVLEVNRRKKQIKLSLKALLPEPVKAEEPVKQPKSFEVQPTREKPARRKKTPRKSEEHGETSEALLNLGETPKEDTDPTAMELALREAMERAKSRKQQDDKAKKPRQTSREQEDILARTLEHKAHTS